MLLIQTASNCQLLALNVAVVHGWLHIMDKVHGRFVLVKEFKSSTCICVWLFHACEHSQTSTAGHAGAHNLTPEAHNERETVTQKLQNKQAPLYRILLTMFTSAKLPCTFPVCYYCWLGIVSGIICLENVA